MNYHFLLPIITLIAWGIWGFFSKLTTNYYRWYEYLIVSSIISLFFSFLLFLFFKTDINFITKGTLYLFSAIFFGTIGTISFYLALTKGKASIIVPLTSLYPAVTLILAKIFLKEEINFSGYIGITLTILAILILSKNL